MIPEILLYEEGRILVTAAAYGIPELKAIIDKYEMNAEPYLLYVRQLSHPNSPYINTDVNELKETAVYDVIQTAGDFDIDDELLEPAIERLKGFYETELLLLSKELGQELKRFREALRDTPLVISGEDANFRERMALMKDINKIADSYSNVKEKATKELEVKMKGKNELGEY